MVIVMEHVQIIRTAAAKAQLDGRRPIGFAIILKRREVSELQYFTLKLLEYLNNTKPKIEPRITAQIYNFIIKPCERKDSKHTFNIKLLELHI